jgi:hypothetical protein
MINVNGAKSPLMNQARAVHIINPPSSGYCHSDGNQSLEGGKRETLSIKSDIIKDQLQKYPNVQKLTLAKAIHETYPDHFTSVEEIRKSILYYTGSSGKKKLQSVSDKYLTADKIAQKYNIPKSINIDYKPHILTGNHGLIFGDTHFPFHSEDALKAMFDKTVGKDYDFVLLNGDTLDFYEVSDFDKRPGVAKLLDEIAMTKAFLAEIKRLYPKARIIFKAANHEARLEKYVCRRAPELYGLEAIRLENLLGLFDLGISYIDADKYIDLAGLSILHGSEIKFSGGRNPAQGLYNATGVTALCNHFHRTSSHSATRLGRVVDTTWSLGAMCQLSPEYARSNQWNLGFGEYERLDDTYWTVHNKMIIGNRVV